MHPYSRKFTLALLHPRYWLTWFGLGIIFLLIQLPLPRVWAVGRALGSPLARLLKRRKHIADVNIALCYPKMTVSERTALVQENFACQGMGIMEMGMGWWWSDRRVRAISEVDGLEHVQHFFAQNRGVMGIAIHNINLEMNARVLGLRQPAINFYRPHNNQLLEYMQHNGRLRSNKMQISKRDVKQLMRVLKQPNLVVYLPDHDYGADRAEFVPFCGAPEAATTTATHSLVKRTNCGVVLIVPLRTVSGYQIKILPAPKDYPTGDNRRDCEIVNQAIAEMINYAPEQYLWTHRRFKTRPSWAPDSVYK